MGLSSTALVAMSVTVGGAIALQAAVNAALARRVGTMEATLISVTITLLLMVVLLAAGLRSGKLAEITSVPPYLFVGGFLGAAILITAVVVVPRLGTGTLIASFIVGQLVAAIILDHFGLFGHQRIPVDLTRIGGAFLLMAGMGMMMR
jgi:transporter family-2 protein